MVRSAHKTVVRDSRVKRQKGVDLDRYRLACYSQFLPVNAFLFRGTVLVPLLERQNSPLTGGERVGHVQHHNFPQLEVISRIASAK